MNFISSAVLLWEQWWEGWPWLDPEDEAQCTYFFSHRNLGIRRVSWGTATHSPFLYFTDTPHQSFLSAPCNSTHLPTPFILLSIAQFAFGGFWGRTPGLAILGYGFSAPRWCSGSDSLFIFCLWIRWRCCGRWWGRVASLWARTHYYFRIGHPAYRKNRPNRSSCRGTAFTYLRWGIRCCGGRSKF